MASCCSARKDRRGSVSSRVEAHKGSVLPVLDGGHLHQRLDIGDMRQRQDAIAIDVLGNGAMVPRNDGKTRVDPAEEGLDLGDFRHLARGGR